MAGSRLVTGSSWRASRRNRKQKRNGRRVGDRALAPLGPRVVPAALFTVGTSRLTWGRQQRPAHPYHPPPIKYPYPSVVAIKSNHSLSSAWRCRRRCPVALCFLSSSQCSSSSVRPFAFLGCVVIEPLSSPSKLTAPRSLRLRRPACLLIIPHPLPLPLPSPSLPRPPCPLPHSLTHTHTHTLSPSLCYQHPQHRRRHGTE